MMGPGYDSIANCECVRPCWVWREGGKRPRERLGGWYYSSSDIYQNIYYCINNRSINVYPYFVYVFDRFAVPGESGKPYEINGRHKHKRIAPCCRSYPETDSNTPKMFIHFFSVRCTHADSQIDVGDKHRKTMKANGWGSLLRSIIANSWFVLFTHDARTVELYQFRNGWPEIVLFGWHKFISAALTRSHEVTGEYCSALSLVEVPHNCHRSAQVTPQRLHFLP